MRPIVWISMFILALSGPNVQAQVGSPDLSGMWSDPPVTPEGLFCFAWCTDAGLDYLSALLDDPANDERIYQELRGEANNHQRSQYIQPRLTAVGLASYPRDPADDPGFQYCEPWGLARQMFAPHQLELTVYDDRIDLRYGEWDAHRTVYLDKREAPDGLSRMGFSVGHYEGDSLVIESTGIAANLTFWSRHSDQLRIVERYTRSEDGCVPSSVEKQNGVTSC